MHRSCFEIQWNLLVISIHIVNDILLLLLGKLDYKLVEWALQNILNSVLCVCLNFLFNVWEILRVFIEEYFVWVGHFSVSCSSILVVSHFRLVLFQTGNFVLLEQIWVVWTLRVKSKDGKLDNSSEKSDELVDVSEFTFDNRIFVEDGEVNHLIFIWWEHLLLECSISYVDVVWSSSCVTVVLIASLLFFVFRNSIWFFLLFVSGKWLQEVK